MRKTLFRSVLSLALIAFLMVMSIGKPTSAPTPCDATVVIISTNDIHSSIDKIPHLASVIDSLRATYPDCVIWADAGDRWTGNPYVDWAEQSGQPIIALLDSLGLDVATLGNHEFDRGQQVLADRIADADFEVICAGIGTEGTPMPVLQPTTVIERGGLRVGFVGVVTNAMNGHPDGNEECYEGLSFCSPDKMAAQYASLDDHVDVLVLLSHAGLPADTLIATANPQYDLVIGGHTHDMLSPAKQVGGTLVTQTRSNLRYVGVTTIQRKDGEITLCNELIKLDTIPASERYEEMVADIKANPDLARRVGVLSRDFDFRAVANLLTDASRSLLGADVAFYHNGGIRVESLPAGDVAKSVIGFVDPFGSRMVRVPMTTEQIEALIVDKFNDRGNLKESHKVDLHPSGVEYEIVVGEDGDAVGVRFDRLQEGKTYAVALPDYVYKNYKLTTQGDVERYLSVEQIMEEYFARHSPLSPNSRVRATMK